MAFNPSDKAAPGAYNASQTALLLLDFHELFVNVAAGPTGKPAASTAASLRKWAHARGIQVIHCPINLSTDPIETCKGGPRFADIVKNMRESGGNEIAELLDGEHGDVTFTRRLGTVSAMGSVGIREYLAEKGTKSVILTGLSTSGCVLFTALAACDLGFVVTTIADACADNKPGVHDMLVSQVLNNRGWVMTAEEFKTGVGKAK